MRIQISLLITVLAGILSTTCVAQEDEVPEEAFKVWNQRQNELPEFGEWLVRSEVGPSGRKSITIIKRYDEFTWLQRYTIWKSEFVEIFGESSTWRIVRSQDEATWRLDYYRSYDATSPERFKKKSPEKFLRRSIDLGSMFFITIATDIANASDLFRSDDTTITRATRIDNNTMRIEGEYSMYKDIQNRFSIDFDTRSWRAISTIRFLNKNDGVQTEHLTYDDNERWKIESKIELRSTIGNKEVLEKVTRSTIDFVSDQQPDKQEIEPRNYGSGIAVAVEEAKQHIEREAQFWLKWCERLTKAEK